MASLWRKWITPRPSDPLTRHREPTIRLILPALVTLRLIYLFLRDYGPDATVSIATLGLLLLLLAVLSVVMLLLGHTYWSGVFLLLLFLHVDLATIALAGYWNPDLLAILAIHLVLAGVLLSVRSLNRYTLFLLLAYVSAMSITYTQLGPPPPAAPSITESVLGIVITGAFIWLMVRYLKHQLEWRVELQTQLVERLQGELEGHKKTTQERHTSEDAIRQLNLELEEKASQLATLNEIACDVSTLSDLQGTLQLVLEKLRLAVSLDVFYVGLHDAESRRIIFPIMYDVGQYWQQETGTLSQLSLAAQVIQSGQPILQNRTAQEMRDKTKTNRRVGDTTRISASLAIVPLPLGERIIGVMSVQSYTPNSYNTRHIDLLVGASYQIAIAVENARLYDSLQAELRERSMAEATIRQLNEELEQRVEQRTAQLALVNQELEAFAYSVSHDLRAPLRAVDGFSRILLEVSAEKLDEQEQHYLRRIRASTQRMGEMIDALLTLSRVTRSEIHWQTVDLSTLAQAIIDTLRQTDPGRRVDVEIAPDLQVQGDRRLLNILLENLIGNAWKYTSKREHARISVGKQQHDTHCAFFVRDNGAGFDPAQADKLFSVFQRLHDDSEFPGTGVGLATVQRIMRRHGGIIWAESGIDMGATLYFSFDYAPQADDADREEDDV